MSLRSVWAPSSSFLCHKPTFLNSRCSTKSSFAQDALINFWFCELGFAMKDWHALMNCNVAVLASVFNKRESSALDCSTLSTTADISQCDGGSSARRYPVTPWKAP